MKIAVATLLFFMSSPALAVSWSNCADGAIMDVSSVSVNPDPVQGGKPATFKITGDHEQDITKGAILDVSVRAFGLQVYRESGSLCAQQDCPLAAGTSTLTFTNDIPGFLPSSTYTTFEGKTADGQVIFCTQIKL